MDADAACLEDIINSEPTATVAMAPSAETDGDSKPMERSLGEDLDSLIKVCEDTQKKLSRKGKHEDKSEEEIQAKNFKKNIKSIAFKKRLMWTCLLHIWKNTFLMKSKQTWKKL